MPLADHPHITLLEKKRAGGTDIIDKIKQELDALGIKLNPTLTKVIKSTEEETVLNAIEAFKEAMGSSNIEKPGA